MAIIAIAASADALAHSYAGLFGWAVHHGLNGWEARSWPAEIDIFVVLGELALYIAYLDRWPTRKRVWPWVTAFTGLAVSVAGNVGHLQALPNVTITTTDRLTAAVSPVAAFAGLMIGLLVLKMSQEHGRDVESVPEASACDKSEVASLGSHLAEDASRIIEEATAKGDRVSQRVLAARLRELGHRFSNAQLRALAASAQQPNEHLDNAALLWPRPANWNRRGYSIKATSKTPRVEQICTSFASRGSGVRIPSAPPRTYKVRASFRTGHRASRDHLAGTMGAGTPQWGRILSTKS
jgi:hypothetical protein